MEVLQTAETRGRSRAWALTGVSIGKAAVVGALVLAVLTPGAAAAGDSCREWLAEHHRLKACLLVLELRGAEQGRIDDAMFELLQREAYLTSCDLPTASARAELVGWRLAGRDSDEFAVGVAESVLERGGLDLDLGRRLGLDDGNRDARVAGAAVAARAPFTRGGPGRRRR